MRVNVIELRQLITDAVSTATTIGELRRVNELARLEIIQLRSDLTEIRREQETVPEHPEDRCQVHGGMCENPEHHSQ